MLYCFALYALSNHNFNRCKTTPRKRQCKLSITTPRHKSKGGCSAKTEAPLTPLTCILSCKCASFTYNIHAHRNNNKSVNLNWLTVIQSMVASFALLMILWWVRSVELDLYGQNRCKGFPRSVSPESSQRWHPCVPLYWSMFKTSARAGKSHEQATRAARAVIYPAGVQTCIPTWCKFCCNKKPMTKFNS